MSKKPLGLTPEEESLCKHIATKILNSSISLNFEGNLCLEIGGQRWSYPTLSDAESLVKFNFIARAMGEAVTTLIQRENLKWLAKNKQALN